MICQLPRCLDKEVLVSFAISSLFTNITLDETKSICTDYLYRCHSMPPSFPEYIFIELTELNLPHSACMLLCIGSLTVYLWSFKCAPFWLMYLWGSWNSISLTMYIKLIVVSVTLMNLCMFIITWRSINIFSLP